MILRTSASRLFTDTSTRSTTLILMALLYLHLLWPQVLGANDIQVANGLVLPNDDNSHLIEFDLSWQNSWHTTDLNGDGVTNWDAAWVFVKYRVPAANGGDGLWKHAWLSNTGHTAPVGVTIDTGLLDPSSAFNAATNPGLGVFVYRSGVGSGANDWDGLRLQWNFAAQGLDASSVVEIRLFAMEMVYVAEGAFYVGSGGDELGRFKDGTTNSAFQINSEAALEIGNVDGQLWGSSTSGNSTIGPAGTLAAAYPKGFAAFYIMKYELSQQQYVDFLNTLTYTQQIERVDGSPATAPGTFTRDANRHGIRIGSSGTNPDSPAVYETTHPFVACNWLGWMDGAAYLDWAGLRPMTELEYEKAARGPAAPVPNEYAWGSTAIANASYSLSNADAAGEAISANYDADGNAMYVNTRGSIGGPLRVGIFATDSSSRVDAGASYWGVMELSGNLWERPVTIGNTDGREYTGIHGDGALSTLGHATTADWPGLSSGQVTDANGSGLRGGSWGVFSRDVRLSVRSRASDNHPFRSAGNGFRGVRTAVGD